MGYGPPKWVFNNVPNTHLSLPLCKSCHTHFLTFKRLFVCVWERERIYNHYFILQMAKVVGVLHSDPARGWQSLKTWSYWSSSPNALVGSRCGTWARIPIGNASIASISLALCTTTMDRTEDTEHYLKNNNKQTKISFLLSTSDMNMKTTPRALPSRK